MRPWFFPPGLNHLHLPSVFKQCLSVDCMGMFFLQPVLVISVIVSWKQVYVWVLLPPLSRDRMYNCCNNFSTPQHPPRRHLNNWPFLKQFLTQSSERNQADMSSFSYSIIFINKILWSYQAKMHVNKSVINTGIMDADNVLWLDYYIYGPINSCSLHNWPKQMLVLVFASSPASTWFDVGACHCTGAWHRAFCLEALAVVNVDVGKADLRVVGAGELDYPLRCSHLLAAGTGVLQGSHCGRVADRRKMTLWKKGKRRAALYPIYVPQYGHYMIENAFIHNWL